LSDMRALETKGSPRLSGEAQVAACGSGWREIKFARRAGADCGGRGLEFPGRPPYYLKRISYAASAVSAFEAR
jgi:hypothetical protein